MSNCSSCGQSSCQCGQSSHLVTPAVPAETCPPTPCNQSMEGDAPLLTVKEGDTIKETIACLKDGDLFRLRMPQVWGDNCCVVGMKASSCSVCNTDWGFYHLRPSDEGTTHAGDNYLIIEAETTTINYVTTPVSLQGAADPAGLLFPIGCGATGYFIWLNLNGAEGSITFNGNLVWSAQSPDSVDRTMIIPIEDGIINYDINLTAGEADIYYVGYSVGEPGTLPSVGFLE